MSPHNEGDNMAKWQEERCRWKTPEMLNLLMGSWNLKGDELGGFLRMHGLTTHDIVSWKQILIDALESDLPVNPNSKKYFTSRIRALEEELREARLINDAQKKVQKILAKVEAENTLKKSEKKSSLLLKKRQKKA
jgi:hypothetical protein